MGARQVSWVPIAGVAWTLPSPARARRACPLPGQGEGSWKIRSQFFMQGVECESQVISVSGAKVTNEPLRDTNYYFNELFINRHTS
jgi:hypothetical protein